jgi:hypothetical protein
MKQDYNKALDHVEKLHKAVALGSLSAAHKYCQKIKREDLNVINQLNNEGSAALHTAIQLGNEELVSILLEAGASPNVKTQSGEPAVTVAIKVGNTSILSKLIEERVDLNNPASCGRLPLKIALELNAVECANLIREHGGLLSSKPQSNKSTSSVVRECRHHEYVNALLASVQLHATCNDFKNFFHEIIRHTDAYLSLFETSVFADSALELAIERVYGAFVRSCTDSLVCSYKDYLNLARKVIVLINTHLRREVAKVGASEAMLLMSKVESIVEEKIVKAKSQTTSIKAVGTSRITASQI